MWEESRGNAIGGLIVAVVLAIISWLGTVYASVGLKPFVIDPLVILWMGYLGYVVYWISNHRQQKQAANSGEDPRAAQPSQGDQAQPAPVEQTSQYHPCFISYSHKDEAFAQKLHADLRRHGVQCWFAPEDLKIGDKIRATIDRSIQSHEKLLLILSENSINSAWVEKEVETAFEKEHKHGQPVLFPIRLDSAVMDTDQVWAADIRRMRTYWQFY